MGGTFIGGKTSDEGVPLVATAPYSYSATDRSRFRGALYSVPPGASVGFDLRVDAPIRLHGGDYWVRGPHLGDTMSFQVVDVDDILGGGPGAVVTEYVTDLPLAPWDHARELQSPTAATVPAGLYLRVEYSNTGAEWVALGVTYRWFLIEGVTP